MNFLGFGQSAEIDIVFDGADSRKYAEVKTEDGKKEKYLLYYDGETVSGKVNITLKKPGSKLEHQGIKIELIGQIELFYDRGNHHEFTSLVKELARPGDLLQNYSYPFEFSNVEKPYEVYVGCNVRLRYFLRVTIVRRLSDIIKEVDIAVHTLCSYPDLNNPIKMEVGIEDCLHIEFEYNKSKYHLKDVIVGKIYFLLVRIKIKHMEIAIIKRETTGSGPNIFTENETIAKYEIMDGAPVKGESIPIRVFLAGYDLTPTMRDINKKFSVKYFLNLVLMDTEDRRYFKQQEITLWRKADKSRKAQSQTANNPHVPTHLVGGPDNDMSKDGSGGGIGKIGGETIRNSHNMNNEGSGVSSENDEQQQQHQSTDPKMGLFTRESPEQESKSLPPYPGKNNSEINSSDAPPIPISADIEQQRGTADGAAASSAQSENHNNIINENASSMPSNAHSTSQTEIATTTTRLNSQQQPQQQQQQSQPQSVSTNSDSLSSLPSTAVASAATTTITTTAATTTLTSSSTSINSQVTTTTTPNTTDDGGLSLNSANYPSFPTSENASSSHKSVSDQENSTANTTDAAPITHTFPISE